MKFISPTAGAAVGVVAFAATLMPTIALASYPPYLNYQPSYCVNYGYPNFGDCGSMGYGYSYGYGYGYGGSYYQPSYPYYPQPQYSYNPVMPTRQYYPSYPVMPIAYDYYNYDYYSSYNAPYINVCSGWCY